MSREKHPKKNEKKKALMTAKEKKAAKRAKRAKQPNSPFELEIKTKKS